MRKNAYWAHLQIRGRLCTNFHLKLPERREKGSTRHDFSLNVRFASLVKNNDFDFIVLHK